MIELFIQNIMLSPTLKTARFIDKLGALCFWSFIVYLVFTLLVEAVFSFSWPKVADVGFLYYLSWLINTHDVQPYLHLYETSFPGTFIFHILIGKIFGYSDFSFHCADILFLSVLLTMTWFLLKPLHVRTATAAVVLFGLYYFVIATMDMHFQRDYLAILPVVASLLIAQRCYRLKNFSFFGIGFLFAVSASIKPHFTIGLPVVMAYAIFLQSHNENISHKYRWFCACTYMLAGFLLWLTICIIWLSVNGALTAFTLMATQYLPIYMSMDGTQAVAGHNNFWNDFLALLTNDIKIRVFIAGLSSAAALYATSCQRQSSALILSIFALCVLYVFYVFLGHKSWDYHWMPFVYFNILCFSFFLTPATKKYHLWTTKFIAICCVAALILSIRFYYNIFLIPAETFQKLNRIHREFRYYPIEEPATQELVNYLKPRTHPGDKIEFRKDGTYGPFFPALLQLQLLPASSFPLHTVLYRSTDNPYIQYLRRQLLQELTLPSQFLLDDAQFAPSGENSFAEYEEFLHKNYEWKYDNLKTHQIPYYFSVYERK